MAIKAIDKMKELYPEKTEEFIMLNVCPHHQFNEIKMTFLDCVNFEYCNDCWEQELPNENTK